MKKKDKKDKHREKTGGLFFFFSGLAASLVISALFAFAGFFAFIPYLNMASAFLLTPVACTLLYEVFSKKTKMEMLQARALTLMIAAAGAYIYICVMMSVLSSVFWKYPIEAADMRDVDIIEYLERWQAIFRNTVFYLMTPGQLWQDLAAWGEEGWHMIALTALAAQIGIPQLFIRKKSTHNIQI